MKNKIILIIATLALVIAGVAVALNSGLFLGSGATHFQKESFYEGLFAGTNRQINISRDGTMTIGTSGSALSVVAKGTCSILANASVAATSTKNFDCAFSGVRAGDIVMAHLSASSTLASQYVVKGYVASSTDGYITFSVLNLTGAAAIPAATNGFGSSTEIVILR